MLQCIFDVDGTLTPSRGRIDEHFASWFEHFATHSACYFVTGSDKPKTQEQLGYIYNLAVRSYQCSGNDVWEGTKRIRQNNVSWSNPVYDFFESALLESEFPTRTGTHLEQRPGLMNFSVVGRQASKQQREEYIMFDRKDGERQRIADNFNELFPEYQASVAGEMGIDIVERGKTKAQIISDFSSLKHTHFFGDKCDPGGNDYEIALAIKENGGIVHHVKDWRDTWRILKSL